MVLSLFASKSKRVKSFCALSPAKETSLSELIRGSRKLDGDCHIPPAPTAAAAAAASASNCSACIRPITCRLLFCWSSCMRKGWRAGRGGMVGGGLGDFGSISYK